MLEKYACVFVVGFIMCYTSYMSQYIKEIKLNKAINDTSYLNDIPAIKYLLQHGKLSFKKDVTFFVGENGTGKSTLIEAIAVAAGFNAEGGTKNFNFSTRRSHSDLWEFLTVSRTKQPKDGFVLRAESFYNTASYIDEIGVTDSYGGQSLHNQSHGESFLALVQNRFAGNGLYILDEPEAALSPMHLLTLMVEIHELVKNNSQFIIATHSPILMAFPSAEILSFSEEGIRSVAYEETEHYQVTKAFLDNPKRMLNNLLE